MRKAYSGKQEAEMNASDWAAWVGACTGVLGLLLLAYQHWKRGPQVSLFANPNMRLLPRSGAPEDKTVYVLVKATNIGTAKTTITHLSICTYSSRWKEWLDRPDDKQGIILTHHPLASPMVLPQPTVGATSITPLCSICCWQKRS